MKYLIATLITLIFIVTSVFARDTNETDKVTPAKSKSIFIFKANKEFLGARVDILTEGGSVITSQQLEKRKVIIDFGSVKMGTYTIRVSKGGKTKAYQYIKK
jgi:hypothetical protein